MKIGKKRRNKNPFSSSDSESKSEENNQLSLEMLKSLKFKLDMAAKKIETVSVYSESSTSKMEIMEVFKAEIMSCVSYLKSCSRILGITNFHGLNLQPRPKRLNVNSLDSIRSCLRKELLKFHEEKLKIKNNFNLRVKVAVRE